MARAAAVSVVTTEYEYSHGHAPKGYGSWGFVYDPTDDNSATEVWVHGPYGEARKEAVARVKAAVQDSLPERSDHVFYLFVLP